jgi:V-type H+-transporting ATPase subunit E
MTTTPSAQSTITNKSRLRLLHKREEVLQQIFSAVREPSTPLYKTAGRYEQFLEGVLAESFLYILEPTVTIHARKSDVVIVEQAATTASRTYKEISGRDISFEVRGTISDEAYVSLA